MFLAAFSAGGHLGWKLALDASDIWSGVAFSCANFAGRGLPDIVATPSARRPRGIANLAIRGFQGALDPRRALLQAQWNAGVALATVRGFANLSYELVDDEGHSPCADAVVAWIGMLERSR